MHYIYYSTHTLHLLLQAKHEYSENYMHAKVTSHIT